jgi:hypothetical protein
MPPRRWRRSEHRPSKMWRKLPACGAAIDTKLETHVPCPRFARGEARRYFGFSPSSSPSSTGKSDPLRSSNEKGGKHVDVVVWQSDWRPVSGGLGGCNGEAGRNDRGAGAAAIAVGGEQGVRGRGRAARPDGGRWPKRQASRHQRFPGPFLPPASTVPGTFSASRSRIRGVTIPAW